MIKAFSKAFFAMPVFLLLSSFAYAEVNTFEQALILAYQNNPSINAERAKLRAIDEQVSQALSGWRPDIEATAEIGKSNQKVDGNGELLRSGNLDPSSESINITQPVFSGFKTVAGVNAAEASVKAQRATLLDAEQKLLLDAGKAFLDVVQAQDTLNINRNNENVLQQQLDATAERLKIGELKKTDVSQAESRLKSAQVSRLQAEGDLTAQRIAFSQIIGDFPSILVQPKFNFDLPKTEEEAISSSFKKNPKIVISDFNAKSAHENVRVAKGNLYPELSLVGNASHSKEEGVLSPDRDDRAEVLARLTIPLYKTGSDYSKIREAQQTEKQTQLELEDARSKARQEVSAAWQSLMTARMAMTGRQDVIKSSEDALDGVKEESKLGTRTILDVLNAEQELLDAKVNLVKATHDEALSMLQLKSATGELTAENLHLPTKIYDPTRNYNSVRNKWAGFANKDD